MSGAELPPHEREMFEARIAELSRNLSGASSLLFAMIERNGGEAIVSADEAAAFYCGGSLGIDLQGDGTWRLRARRIESIALH